ncbi:MAG: PLP-dependent aminotransferase family protein [Bacteroidota bacterium]
MIGKRELLYMQIANGIEQQIKHGVLKVGDKLPSLRTICLEQGVSLSSSSQAYLELESRGFIESRPRTGYFVSFSHKDLREVPSTSQPRLTNASEDPEDIINTITGNAAKANIFLSSGIPALSLLPVAKLNKGMIQAMRSLPDSGINYERQGNTKLKQQIARRSLSWGGKLREDEIVTTSGCMEALAFSMLALAERGDTIAVESPVYYGIPLLAKSIGLKVIELPTHPVTGVELDALEKAFKKNKVKLCLFVTNFNNPLGSMMPVENKKAVVKLLEKYNVPLIEDDLYGDLYFGDHRPLTCKSFDESGMVLWCGSFSKTLSAGYRVGWVAPGKFLEKVKRIKHYHAISCNALAHETIANFLENDRYENHLRKLRQTLHRNTLQFHRFIGEYFPKDTLVSRPQGGFHLWVEFNKRTDTIELYNQLIQHRISFTPGRIFTLQNQYNNCLRLSTGLLLNDRVEGALKLMGKIAGRLAH